jgi:hypothetical protein
MAGPGVLVSTATRSGPAAFPRALSGQFFVVGLTERGAVGSAIKVNSMSDYARLCGGRVAYGSVYDSLKTFFEEGGSQAYVSRVAGGAATLSTLTLVDRATSPGVNTLRVDAANPGAWGTGLTVEVADGATADTVKVTIRLNGDIVEEYNNLASPDAVVSAFTGSPYVTITNLGSVTAAPDNLPKVIAATALTGGDDDRGAVVTADYEAALDAFGIGLGDGAVAIPGQGTAVHAAIDTHCKENRRLGLLAAARGASVATLTAAAANVNSEFCGLFAPWVMIPDGGGGVRAVSPEGYVAAVRNRAHEQEGPWRAPAGGNAVARFVVGVDQAFTRADGDTLDTGRVSPIRIIANSIRLYGWRSLSQDEQNYSLLNGRDVLNRLVTECERRLEQYVFQTIDAQGHLLSAVNAELRGVVDPMAQAGGLYALLADNGDIIDPGYKVDTGPNVNPVSQLALNRISAVLSVRVSPVGALVSLTIVKVGVLAAV